MDGFLPRKGVTLCSTGNEFEPMRRCLAPEVVSRRDRTGPQASKRRNADEVGVTLNAALACSPDNRIKWFMKACEMAKNGRASGNELFNIISNKKFLAGLDTRTGTTLCGLAHESASLFSEGQVRYMQSNEWLLNAKFGFNEDEKSPDEAPEERSPSNDDEERPVFRTRHPDGDEEVARRLELERKLDAQEKERRYKREVRLNTAFVQDVDFTVRLMSKQPEKTTEELEQEADNSLQVLEQLNQRHTGERRRRREEPDEDPRDAADSGRRRRRREESIEVQKNNAEVGERRRRRREEVEEDLGDVLDGGDRRRRRREEPEDGGDNVMDGGERRRRRREEQVELPGEAEGGERFRRRREGIEDRESADVVDDGAVRRRRRRRRSNLDVPSPPPEQDHPGSIKRRRRQNRSQSTSVSVQAARISPSSSREPDRRRHRGSGSSALARYDDNSVGRYPSHRQADEFARRQADEVAAHREHVRKEAEDLASNKRMLSMQHVEALRDVYRQDRISRNRAKLMKLGLGHELGM